MCESKETVVQFATQDGVLLEADYRPAAKSGQAALILLHMIPPSNTREGYPQRVRSALSGLGFAVLNVDRRGAGGSAGNPKDAYQGVGGRYDAEAAVRFVTSTERTCPADPGAIILVGASNGTTSTLDYAVLHDAGLPRPRAIVWMSPGAYTENQTAVGSALDGLPMLWLFPTTELWSLDARARKIAGWTFVQRGEQHGTRMFDGGALEEDTMTSVSQWLAPLAKADPQ